MAQDRYPHIEFRILFPDTFCIVHRAACAILVAFRHNDDGTVLALADAAPDELGELVDVGAVFRNDGGFSTGGDGTVLRQEAGVAAHHFHEEDAVVRGGGVADLVDAVDDGVERRVVADGRVGAIEIVVDGAGQADDRDVVLTGQFLRSGERAVAADDDQRADMILFQGLIGLVAPFHRTEFIAAGRLEDGAAALDGVAHRFAGELLDLAVDESLPPPVDAVDFQAFEDGGAGDRADGRIHARGVTAGRQYTNRQNFFFHNIMLYRIVQYRLPSVLSCDPAATVSFPGSILHPSRLPVRNGKAGR